MKTLLQPKRLQKSVLQRLTLFLWPLKFMPIFQTWFLESIYVSIKFYPFSTKMVKISIIFQTKTAQKPILFGAATYIAYVGKYSIPNPPPSNPDFFQRQLLTNMLKRLTTKTFLLPLRLEKVYTAVDFDTLFNTNSHAILFIYTLTDKKRISRR